MQLGGRWRWTKPDGPIARKASCPHFPDARNGKQPKGPHGVLFETNFRKFEDASRYGGNTGVPIDCFPRIAAPKPGSYSVYSVSFSNIR